VALSVRGAAANMTLRLNGQELGSAAQPRLWTPRAGSYHLTLEDNQGQALARVLFTVRAASM
jgi:hypothetical protein